MSSVVMAQVPTPRRAPILRAASFEDYRGVAELEARHGLVAKSRADWSHLWRGNPAYFERDRDWRIGWVLEDNDSNIVGSIGNIPLLYEFGTRTVLTTSARAWVVDPVYRSFAPLLLDSVINQTGVDLYLNNTAGPSSLAPLDAFRCSAVPAGIWDQSAFWITDQRGFWQSALGAKMRWLATPLSYPLSAADLLCERLSRKALRGNDHEVKVCTGFDDRFDDFWLQLKLNHPGLLLAVRTRAVLEWHFHYALRQNRLWIVTVQDGASFSAYAIFDRRTSRKSGLRRARLVDFQSLDGSVDLLSPIVVWALKKCEDEGIHLLETTGRWLEKGGFIREVAPHRRSLSSWTYFYRANDPRLSESLRCPNAWAPSLFDGDATL